MNDSIDEIDWRLHWLHSFGVKVTLKQMCGPSASRFQSPGPHTTAINPAGSPEARLDQGLELKRTAVDQVHKARTPWSQLIYIAATWYMVADTSADRRHAGHLACGIHRNSHAILPPIFCQHVPLDHSMNLTVTSKVGTVC